MNPGIVFAILGAITFGLWTVFHQQASKLIDNLFGAIIVSATAVILGLLLLFSRAKTSQWVSDPKGVLFVVLAGICALGIDYFALKSYNSGLSISVAGPIIIGGSIAVATIIGIFLGESISPAKILGVTLVMGGAAVLASLAK